MYLKQSSDGAVDAVSDETLKKIIRPMLKTGLKIYAGLLVMLAAVVCQAEPAGQLVQRKSSGRVNWSAGIVGVRGSGNAAVSDLETQINFNDEARANATDRVRA